SEGFAVRRDLHYELVAETGRADGGNTYLRVSGTGHLLLPAGATRLLVRALGGVATRALPAHRSFVLGGRGTLLGDDFRRWGGGPRDPGDARPRARVARRVPVRGGGGCGRPAHRLRARRDARFLGHPVSETGWTAPRRGLALTR